MSSLLEFVPSGLVAAGAHLWSKFAQWSAAGAPKVSAPICWIKCEPNVPAE